MRRTAPLLAWLPCLVAVAACTPGPSRFGPTDTGPDTPDPTDTATDTPTPTPTDTAPPITTPPDPVALVAPEVVYGVPNVDNAWDWGLYDPTDDEIVTFEITPSQNTAPDRFVLRLADGASVRIWHDGDLLLDEYQLEADLPWQADPLVLGVEFRDFDTDDTLTVEEVDAGDAVLYTGETRLRAGPMFLNHHLQPAELVVATSVNTFFWDNNAFIDGLVAELGNVFVAANGGSYDYDVWIQDEIEFAWGTTPEGGRMNVVIDSIRDRGLDDYPEDAFQGEGFGVVTFGGGFANTYDSFGNLETSPPIEGWPQGRVYYGSNGGAASPNDEVLFDYLESLGVQDPFTVDTSWLCVGHVDEWMSFVPDPTAPRGFRFVYTDTTIAWQLLEAMDPATEIPRWAGSQNHGYSTVGDILADTGLRALNDDLQVDHLDPILDQMKTELGLLDEEVVLLPGLFEEPFGCGRSVAALIPGMVNLTVVEVPGQTTRVFMADPFLRTDLADQSTDPFITEVRARMPSSLEIVFLDDWETYHMALGEVHCGTNVLRTPEYEWWVDDVEGGAP